MRNFAPPLLNLDRIREVKQRIMSARLAFNTVMNYRSGWKAFVRWCESAGVPSLPATPQVCIDYCSWCFAEGARLSTVDLRIRAIRHYHREANLASPIDASVREFLKRAARELCEEPRGKEALTVDHLRRISQKLLRRGTTRDARDRAILLVGFACGWRRSELV